MKQRMTSIAVLTSSLAALGACMTPPPIDSGSDPVACGADKVQNYVGRTATPDVRAEVERVSGAARFRWLTPEMMMTTDYVPDRLNIHLGTTNKIGSLRCG